MEKKRNKVINIGEEEYEMILTTKAVKAISERYIGMEKFGKWLIKIENFSIVLDEIVWLITLLSNQSVLVHNLRHKDAPKNLLTEEYVELLAAPMELLAYKDIFTEAMLNGKLIDILNEFRGDS